MADFQTHLIGGAVAGAAVAVAGTALGVIAWPLAPLIALTGLVGGLAPDIDSDHGRPIAILFRVAAVTAPLAVVYRVPALSEPWWVGAGVWAGLALIVRYPASWIFARLTVHRGIFHSLPAAVIFGALVALFAARHEARPRLQLLMGAAGVVGYLTHLLLDELWSVDFNGRRLRVKRSFGTAMRVWGLNWWTSVCAYAAAVGLAWLVWQDVQGERPERLFERHVLKRPALRVQPVRPQ